MTNKQSFRFFLIMLMLFAVTMCVIGYSMASAFNLSPYTFKLRSKTTAADSLYIKGDTLYCNQMAVSLHAVMQAVAVQTDTVRGSSTIVGITDDTLIVDADSTGSAVTIRFGRWGGGLRWNRATDAMQYTNDFSTWTAIGTGGSSTTNADSLFHIPAFVRPQTDGYVLKFDADGDSLYLAADATGGGSADSNAITYETDRLASYSDSAMYFGDIGDSTMLRFLGDSSIIAFAKVFYDEDVDDSALVTWGAMMAQVGATGSGDITGVITSGDWLEGGASSGDVALNIRAIYEDAYQVVDDTTAIEGTAIKLRQPAGNSSVTMVDDAISLQNTNSGSIVLNVDGTPTNTDELTITENNIAIRSAGSNGVLYLSGYDLERVAHVAIGSIFTSGGTSSAPTWQSIKTVIDSLTGTAIPLADSTNGGAIRSEITKTVAHPWLYAYIDTSRARIPASDTAYAVLHSWLYGYIDTSVATIPRSTLADSTSGGAARAEAAKLAYRLTAPQGSANTFGRMVGDSIDVDSIHAGRISVGTDASITDITGDGLAIAAGALTASLGTAITSSEITDGTIALADYGANSIDSTKIMPSSVLKSELAIESVDSTKIIASSVLSPEIADGAIALADYGANSIDSTKIMPSSIKASELTVNVVDSTHLTANSVLASEIATGAVATAEILDRTVAAIDIDTSATIKANKFNGNWLTAWPDSTLNLGSGAGLTITSSILLGTDITDDTTVVDFYPEPSNVVLANSLMSQYNDSIKIYGVIDSLLGNTLHFRDSTLNTHGLRRRGFQMTVSHPMRVDSLRYVIIEGLVKDSSATNTMWLKGMLRTTTFTTSCLDSNAAANIKDYDSLGGDWGDAAAIRRFVLTGGAVTPGTPWYLMITARHGSGTAWNWAEVWRIRFVYSRTAV